MIKPEILPEALPIHARRQAAEAQGRAAEDRAAEFFQAKHYSVLARRARTEAGEIDLVVADPMTLIFVEVKRRRTLLAAAEALQPRQCRRIAGAAAILLARNPEWQRSDTRFDVILVTDGKVTHLADAFRPE